MLKALKPARMPALPCHLGCAFGPSPDPCWLLRRVRDHTRMCYMLGVLQQSFLTWLDHAVRALDDLGSMTRLRWPASDLASAVACE